MSELRELLTGGDRPDSDKWEIRLQIVRALPLLRWTARERPRVIEILTENVDYPQTFVRAWALDGLATFSQKDPRLTRLVRKKLVEFERSDSKALQARARNIRARLDSSRTRTVRPATMKSRVRSSVG